MPSVNYGKKNGPTVIVTTDTALTAADANKNIILDTTVDNKVVTLPQLFDIRQGDTFTVTHAATTADHPVIVEAYAGDTMPSLTTPGSTVTSITMQYGDKIDFVRGTTGWIAAKQSSSKATTAALVTLVQNTLYPVGSYYINGSVTTDPATLLGFGTWTRVTGRVLVGYNSAETEFNALLAHGGAKTHTLSETEIPPHAHPLKSENIQLRSPADYNRISYTTLATTATTATTENAGGGDPHNNLQPYEVASIWRRTA